MLIVGVHCPAHSAMLFSAEASLRSSRRWMASFGSSASAEAIDSPGTMPRFFAAGLAAITSGR